MLAIEAVVLGTILVFGLVGADWLRDHGLRGPSRLLRFVWLGALLAGIVTGFRIYHH
jgi:hypothetical protein